jgi:phosphopantothenate---cysteine ligase (CTP)
MRILVTAGNTQTPIDRVRCITNIFTGRTGAGIALAAHQRGQAVHLLTSHPDVVVMPAASETWRLATYRTYEDLARLLEREVRSGSYDAIVHAAAVSDYAEAGIFAPAAGTHFTTQTGCWSAEAGSPRLIEVRAGKVASSHQELWLRLTPTPKLVDKIRTPWGFTGVLVKFKLEVDVSEDDLRTKAEQARRQSQADWMVANTLEGMNEWALIGPVAGRYEKTPRGQLASRLLDLIGAG